MRPVTFLPLAAAFLGLVTADDFSANNNIDGATASGGAPTNIGTTVFQSGGDPTGSPGANGTPGGSDDAPMTPTPSPTSMSSGTTINIGTTVVQSGGDVTGSAGADSTASGSSGAGSSVRATGFVGDVWLTVGAGVGIFVAGLGFLL